jgi:DNA-binding transcriptional LysR family regulator
MVGVERLDELDAVAARGRYDVQPLLPGQLHRHAAQGAGAASQAYLDLRGRPEQPADLVEHECIVLRGPQRQAMWQLQSRGQGGEAAEVAVRGRFTVNNVGLMRQLAVRGMGIAVLAPSLLRDEVSSGRLEQVLPGWATPSLPIHAVMSSRLQPASVRAFVEFLALRLASG